MIKIFTSTIIPIMSWNMALVADPSFEAVVIPALKVLTRRAVGPLGRAAIRVEGVGEIFGVGTLSLPVAPAVLVQTVAAAIMMLEFGDSWAS